MASIKDVAKKANVGIATVSRVLNNSGFVSKETRVLVLDAIKALNYVPNEVARSFQKKQTNFIGVIVPDIKQKFTTELLSQLEQDLSDLGYFVLLFVSNHDESKEIEYLEKFKSQQVVGTIITAPFMSEQISQLYTSLPIVSFDRKISDTIPCIHVDNYQGAYEISLKLASKSTKKMAYVGFGADSKSMSQQRIEAFKAVCQLKKRSYTVFNKQEKQNDRAFIESVYQASQDIDGYFFGCDHHAQIFLNILKDRANEINKTLYIVGFDGLKDNAMYQPELTTVVQPIETISKEIIKALMKKINNPNQHVLDVTVPYDINTGATCT